MATANPYRLPRTVEPERYELTLTPDIDAARFSGEERIHVAISQETDVIQLNAAELEIFSAELINDDGQTISGETSVDEETEILTIRLGQPAQPGSWNLHITFAGTLNDKLRGFYRSTFTDDQGVERVIATTQFESTDARRAFPCWDEPDFKAVFAVTLIVDADLAAFSNASVTEENLLDNNKRQIEFADTMKMSTYLVAFVVGPLVATDAVNIDGTPMRIACIPGREHLTSFALEVGGAALRYYAEYFKIPYRGDKIDHIALPDFAAGAMENLGCVTYRETALLVDTERASRLEIERVADVIAHETAHMWFGDLVTMKWWNGIWLNEAFATFMELLFVDQFRPDWERWVSFGLEKSAAMNVDSLSSTRPVEYPVQKPEEAQGMFDLLTYQKGGAVLRMLEQHLGDQTFATGISAYLHDHEYGNAETTDLWDALEETSDQPVRAMMDSWIFQGGHPIVHVEQVDDTTLRLSQKRFLYESTGVDTTSWHIPISLRAMVNNSLHHEKLLLTEDSATVQLPGTPDWVVVNEHGNGFYRVSYESSLLEKLTENVHALDSLERFNLATDSWAACLAGTVGLRDMLKLARLMKGDDDPNVWGALLAPLRLAEKMLDEHSLPKLRAFVKEIASSGHEWLGWEPHQGESERIATLRGVLIGALGTLADDEGVQREAAARYAAYQMDPTSLDTNLVDATQSVLAHTNDPAHYETLYKKFVSDASTPQEQIKALQTLALFTAPALLDRTLEMIENGEVRTQDAPYAIRVMLTRRETAAQVWQWVEQHWDDFMERFPDNSIARMVDGLIAQTDPQLAQRAEGFLQAHPIPQAQLSVDQTLERLRVNVAFYERQKAGLSSLFD